jgi:hypothetical protein
MPYVQWRVGPCIILDLRVLVVGVYKLAAREGSSPMSRLGECGSECESVVPLSLWGALPPLL